ncbi:MAG: SpoIIE family protein phosphatase [Bacillota bacterium]|nr:SpoIIE family protein phosphatase [Bacillota bacterium]
MTAIWGRAALAVSAVLIGRSSVLGLTVPFAGAYYSALRHGRPRLASGIALGLLAGCLSTGDMWTSARLGLTMLAIGASVRWSGWHRGNRRWKPALPAAGFAAASVGLSHLPLALFGGMGLAELWFAAVEMLTAAVVTAMAHASLGQLVRGRQLTQLAGESTLALIVMLGAALTGLRGVNPLGIELAAVAGALVTMFLARAGGGAVGALTGVAVGLATTFSGQGSPVQIGVWAVAGLMAGIAGDLGTIGAAIGFSLGQLCLAGAVPDAGFVGTSLWHTALAAAVLALLPSRVVGRARLVCRGPDAADQGAQVSAALWLLAASRLSVLADVFKEIACAFEPPLGLDPGGLPRAATDPAARPKSGFPPPARPRAAHLAAGGDGRVKEVIEHCCAGCDHWPGCWDDKPEHTARRLTSLINRIERGTGAAGTPAEAFVPWCRRGSELLAAVRRTAGQAGDPVVARAPAVEVRRLLAKQLTGVAGITADLAQRMTLGDIPAGLLRAQEIEEVLTRAGLGVRQALLTPAPRGFEVHVHAQPCGASWCTEHAAAAASTVVGRQLAVCGKQCELPGGGCYFMLTTEPRLEVVVGRARRGRELVSGDSSAHRPVNGQHYLLLLCDGMGSGTAAARESITAVRLVEAMLDAGFSLEATMDTINSVLYLRSSQEAFTTIDLALADLHDGHLDMVKIGACPSYLLRDGQVQVLAAKGLPLGIVDDVPISRITQQLRQGDSLVMISDGVFGGRSAVSRREDWLARTVARTGGTLSPQELADALLSEASARQPRGPDDDMTVLVASLRRRGAAG